MEEAGASGGGVALGSEAEGMADADAADEERGVPEADAGRDATEDMDAGRVSSLSLTLPSSSSHSPSRLTSSVVSRSLTLSSSSPQSSFSELSLPSDGSGELVEDGVGEGAEADTFEGVAPPAEVSPTAAAMRAVASASKSQDRLVPGLLTRGRAKHLRSLGHGCTVHFPPIH